jgi:hypothetical protein
MNDTFNGIVGKTVARVDFLNRFELEGREDIFTLVFTDGSMLTVCENEPEFCWNGLEICASLNPKENV